jgi:crotonobetainyl-CoA:carnitine CoA-transferase CaiB-like acyl-CoA transferase
MLPAIALTDEVTGITAAFAAMVALHSGVGQVVDVNLLTTIFQMMGPVVSLYKLTGELQPRLGSGLPYTVPRGVYQCADGKWVGVSASSDTVAARVMKILDLETDKRFTSFAGRMEHRELLQELMGKWCATRTRDEVVTIFEEAEAAVGPVFDMSDIATDPHYAARNMIQEVGNTPMQGLIAALSKTPGVLSHEGRSLDSDRDNIITRGWTKNTN